MRFAILLVACIFVLIGSPVEAEEAEFCKTFVDKNTTCRDDLLKTCKVKVHELFLQQLATMPQEFRSQIESGLDDKVDGQCRSFVSQTTGEKALGECRTRMSESSPEIDAKRAKINACFTKNSCAEYAECAVEFN